VGAAEISSIVREDGGAAREGGNEVKEFTNTHLAYLTSLLILIAVIYSFIVNEPLYEFTYFVSSAVMMTSIVTLAIHFNALKENKEKKGLILVSLVVPIATLIYFAIGLSYIYISGA